MRDSSDRQLWIDSWKGVLIFLVVLGHALGGVLHYCRPEDHALLERVFIFIYSFHMPAFFAIAGYLYRRHDASFAEFVLSRFKRLIVPFYVFGFASLLIYLVMNQIFMSMTAGDRYGYYAAKETVGFFAGVGSLLYGANLPGTDAFRVNTVLWFPPALFANLVVFYILERLLFTRWRYLELALIPVCLVGGWVVNRVGVPSMPYGLTSPISNLMYFEIGRMIRSIDAARWGHRALPCGWKSGCAARWGHRALPIALSLLSVAAMFFWTWKSPFYPWYGRDFVKHFVHVMQAAGGIVASMMLVRAIPMKWMTYLGTVTLGIMFTHKFVVMALQFGIPFIKRMPGIGLAQCTLSVLLVTLVALAASYLVTRIILRYFPFALGVRR